MISKFRDSGERLLRLLASDSEPEADCGVAVSYFPPPPENMDDTDGIADSAVTTNEDKHNGDSVIIQSGM